MFVRYSYRLYTTSRSAFLKHAGRENAAKVAGRPEITVSAARAKNLSVWVSKSQCALLCLASHRPTLSLATWLPQSPPSPPFLHSSLAPSSPRPPLPPPRVASARMTSKSRCCEETQRLTKLAGSLARFS